MRMIWKWWFFIRILGLSSLSFCHTLHFKKRTSALNVGLRVIVGKTMVGFEAKTAILTAASGTILVLCESGLGSQKIR